MPPDCVRTTFLCQQTVFSSRLVFTRRHYDQILAMCDIQLNYKVTSPRRHYDQILAMCDIQLNYKVTSPRRHYDQILAMCDIQLNYKVTSPRRHYDQILAMCDIQLNYKVTSLVLNIRWQIRRLSQTPACPLNVIRCSLALHTPLLAATTY